MPQRVWKVTVGVKGQQRSLTFLFTLGSLKLDVEGQEPRNKSWGKGAGLLNWSLTTVLKEMGGSGQAQKVPSRRGQHGKRPEAEMG